MSKNQVPQSTIDELIEFNDAVNLKRFRSRLRSLVMSHIIAEKGDLGDDFRLFLSELECLFRLFEVMEE